MTLANQFPSQLGRHCNSQPPLRRRTLAVLLSGFGATHRTQFGATQPLAKHGAPRRTLRGRIFLLCLFRQATLRDQQSPSFATSNPTLIDFSQHWSQVAAFHRVSVVRTHGRLSRRPSYCNVEVHLTTLRWFTILIASWHANPERLGLGVQRRRKCPFCRTRSISMSAAWHPGDR